MPSETVKQTRSASAMNETFIDALGYEGFIDAVEDGRVFGWALDRDHPKKKVEIDIFFGQEKIGSVKANRFREDLRTYGDGSGKHAFVFNLPKEYWSRQPSLFHACYAGTDVPLLRGDRCAVLTKGLSLDELTANDQPRDGAARSSSAAGTSDIAPVLLPLVARIEACERAVVGMAHMIHPSSELEREKASRVNEFEAALAALRNDLEGLETFISRQDGRLKSLGERMAEVDIGPVPWFRQLSAWSLAVAGIALAIALLSYW